MSFYSHYRKYCVVLSSDGIYKNQKLKRESVRFTDRDYLEPTQTVLAGREYLED